MAPAEKETEESPIGAGSFLSAVKRKYLVAKSIANLH